MDRLLNAIDGLIQRGFIEEEYDEENDDMVYRPTEKGEEVAERLE